MKSSSVEAIIYLRVQLNFCPCFLYLLSHLGEIHCKKSDRNIGRSCLLHANWRRVAQTLLLGTSDITFMHIPSSL